MPEQPTPFQGSADIDDPNAAVSIPENIMELPNLGDAAIAKQPTRPPKLSRRKSIAFDDITNIVNTLEKRFNQDLMDRQDWLEMRLQRYAKYRGWLEPKSYPWPNSANSHIPMMMTDSQHMQDTLHNAVLANRPVMSAKALRSEDSSKVETVDSLLDYQIFVEQPGEERIAELIDSYVNDGQFILFLSWVRDKQRINDIKAIGQVPENQDIPPQVLQQYITQALPKVQGIVPHPKDIFKWRVEGVDDDGMPYEAKVKFYTDESDRLLMEITRDVVVYDGPAWIPKEITDIVVPSRCTNLQIPGPANPGGAPHVYVVDRPTRDEIIRLIDSGYYDLATDEDINKLNKPSGQRGQSGSDPDAMKLQKDTLEGRTYGNAETSDANFTRIIAFERWDINGDGLDEDVVFWWIKETKTLLRARNLSEIYPSIPPRRPFAEARMLPIPGQFYGISLLELMEQVYDLVKTLFDQMVDAGTLAVTPWGLYRTGSSMRPESIKMAAGELYPTSDPQRDVAFPQPVNPSGLTWAINTIGMLMQWNERETMVGDLQLGRVPYGKASALRTASTTQTILQQGDARPERVLRRFFRGLAEAYQQTHELNMAFLPPKKYYRITGNVEEADNPYRILEDPQMIRGRFQFDFAANILNTNKAAHAQVMQTIAGALLNGMTMQTGLVDPVKMYHIYKEWIKALGETPGKFMNKPHPQADGPQLTAGEAFAQILNGQMPKGRPAEGVQAHLQSFMQFMQDPVSATIDQQQIMMIEQWMQQLQQMATQQQQQMELANQAGQAAQGTGQAPPGGQQMGPMGTGQQPMQPNELMNESLPMAGGGAMGAQMKATGVSG